MGEPETVEAVHHVHHLDDLVGYRVQFRARAHVGQTPLGTLVHRGVDYGLSRASEPSLR